MTDDEYFADLVKNIGAQITELVAFEGKVLKRPDTENKKALLASIKNELEKLSLLLTGALKKHQETD